jgi:mRNA-degrading endonuclease RelE of RelBE toxin-antitoxin system
MRRNINPEDPIIELRRVHGARVLGGGLKGFWKLKGGAYRVIYRIFEKEKLVDVALVGFWRNAEAYDFIRRRRLSRRP